MKKEPSFPFPFEEYIKDAETFRNPCLRDLPTPPKRGLRVGGSPFGEGRRIPRYSLSFQGFGNLLPQG
jgi:hypothetical protein